MSMLKLGFGGRTGSDIRHVVAIGAHSDDIELGCGGLFLEVLKRLPGVSITWLVLSADGSRADEATASAHAFCGSRQIEVDVAGFRDGYLPFAGAEVKDHLSSYAKAQEADLVLVPSRFDAHQDHRFVGELSYQLFRDSLILEYEILKYDGDLWQPNFYVPLRREIVDEKVLLLHQHFLSQREKHWFSEESFKSLMRIRGVESRASDGYAEAFFCSKLVIQT